MPILWTDQHTDTRQARIRTLQARRSHSVREWLSTLLPYALVVLLAILGLWRHL